MFVVNGFPVEEAFFDGLAKKYTRVITIEDGLIGTRRRRPARLRRVRLPASSPQSAVSCEHFGIVDPQIAPSETFESCGSTSA